MTYRFRMSPTQGMDDRLGFSVLTVPDFDGDGEPDYVISVRNDHVPGSGIWGSGSVFIFRSGDLNAADAADGTVDRTINIDDGQAGAAFGWRLVGTFTGENLGREVHDAGDLDNDGQNELAISFRDFATNATVHDYVYLVNFDGIVAADAADGNSDRIIYMDRLVGQSGNYKIAGVDGIGYETTGIGRTDGTGQDFFVLGSPAENGGKGAVYLINQSDFANLDAVSQSGVNGQFDITTAFNTTNAPNSYKILGVNDYSYAGFSVANIGDIDGDGFEEVAIGAYGATGNSQYAGQVYIVSQRDLAEADLADGTADGTIRLTSFLNTANFTTDGMQSLVIDGQTWNENLGRSVGAAGDVDGDGKADLMVSALYTDVGSRTDVGAAYFIASSDRVTLDALDGASDNRVDITYIGNPAFHTMIPNSYMFIPPVGGFRPGDLMTSAGDWNGDGVDDLLIGMVSKDPAVTDSKGRIYFISGTDLEAIDAIDGDDGRINLGNVHLGTNSYEILPVFEQGSGGDVYGRSFNFGIVGSSTGRNTLIIGVPNVTNEAWVLEWRDREYFDNRDGDGAGGPDAGVNDNIFTLNWSTPVCFTAGTLIRTARGDVPVEALRVGDLVLTRDHGLQPLRWAGARRFGAAEIAMAPQIAPVRISAGALGPAMPAQDLVVSPQHRILVTGGLALRLAGAAEVLIAAKHLVGLPGIAVAPAGEAVWYHHILFDRHEIVEANGAPAESLLLGPEARRVLSPEALEEIALIFPDIGLAEPARPIARGGDLRRHARRAEKVALDGRV